MDWNDLAHFLALMRAGSLRAAGKELGVSPTTVARRVAALEAALGAPLFVRATSGFVPTDTAHELAASGREVEEKIVALERRAGPRGRDVTGDVRLSTTEVLGAEVVAPAIPALLAQHPGLRVALRTEARLVSFARHEADIAVRMSRPDGARLVARRLAVIELGLFASQTYLARGRQRRLADERLLGYDDTYGAIPETAWFTREGLDGALVFRTGSSRAIFEATRAGAGIGLLPVFLARRVAELVRVDAPSPLPQRAVYVVTHEDLRRRPAVRAVWDHLVASFARI